MFYTAVRETETNGQRVRKNKRGIRHMAADPNGEVETTEMSPERSGMADTMVTIKAMDIKTPPSKSGKSGFRTVRSSGFDGRSAFQQNSYLHQCDPYSEMKVSMLFGGLLYLARGVLVIFPFALAAALGALSIHIAISGASLTTEEPLWVLAVGSIFIAFIEEHYFREREYEAFALSLVGTALILGIAFLLYTSRTDMLPYLAYALIVFGLTDFILGFEYHKPGHHGRMKERKKNASS